MSDEVVVSTLKERRDCCWLIPAARGPGADGLKARDDRNVDEFATDLLDAKTAPVAWDASSQSQNAGQKSNP